MSLIAIEELQDYLVDQGIGNLPSADPSSTVPRIFLMGRDGSRLPEAPETTTITLRDTMLAPASELEAFIEEAFIDVIIRSTSAATGKLLHRSIRNLLHPTGDHGGRKAWDMADLHVEYSTIWRGEQDLPPDPQADIHTYDRVASYRIGARRALLA